MALQQTLKVAAGLGTKSHRAYGIRDAASGECGKGVIQNLQICFWCPFVLIYLLIFWTNLDLGVILQWATML